MQHTVPQKTYVTWHGVCLLVLPFTGCKNIECVAVTMSARLKIKSPTIAFHGPPHSHTMWRWETKCGGWVNGVALCYMSPTGLKSLLVLEWIPWAWNRNKNSKFNLSHILETLPPHKTRWFSASHSKSGNQVLWSHIGSQWTSHKQNQV